jgi:hypothetical protein
MEDIKQLVFSIQALPLGLLTVRFKRSLTPTTTPVRAKKGRPAL